MSELREDKAQERVDLNRLTKGLPIDPQKPGEGVPEEVRNAVGIKCASVGASGTDDQDWEEK